MNYDCDTCYPTPQKKQGPHCLEMGGLLVGLQSEVPGRLPGIWGPRRNLDAGVHQVFGQGHLLIRSRERSQPSGWN